MFEAGYKRVQYSDQAAQPTHDWRAQGISLGMAAGAGVGLFAYGMMPRADGTRGIDDLARYARTAGNLSPFQILNTFRVPEWVSPFTSPSFQELSKVGNAYQMEIGNQFLKNTETYSYLKQLTGMSASQLSAAGILPKGIGPAGTTASKLLFEKTNGADVNGRLYSVVGEQRHLLHANAALLQFSGETVSSGDLFSTNEPVNKVVKSVFAEMDLWGGGNWREGSERKVFTHRKAGDLQRPKFIPIPGFAPSMEGTTYLRASGTFSMERFNQLLTNTGEEILGKRGTNVIKKLGLGFGVTSGPSHVMYGRFGMKAAGLIGAGLLLNESDWWRRQGGVLGQTAASAGVSFGLGAVVAKAGFGGKAGMMAGIAAFAGQMIMPGFDQGVLPGIASTWALGTEARAFKANPFSSYRQTLEGLLPGVSGIGMGLAAGVALAGASYVRVPGTGQALPNFLLGQFGHKAFGMARRAGNQMDVVTPKNIRDHFWDMTLDWARKNVTDPQIASISAEHQRLGGYSTIGMRSRLSSAIHRGGKSPSAISQQMNTMWAQAEEMHKSLQVGNPVNAALRDRLTDIDVKYAGRKDLASKGLRQLEAVGEQIRHSFFGANIAEEGMSKFITQKGFTGAFGRAGLLFATGLLTHQLATGALLGSMQSREELQDIYSGRQLVEVESGRWWEGGGSPWEGKDRSTFRPHWLPTMLNRVRQAGIWGADEDRRSPLTKAFLSNFTYTLEREQYYDRPYPMSAAFGANIPIIGPILGATIGQVIKPSKLMHTGEWIQGNEGHLQFASVYEGWKREPAYNLGAAQPGIPTSPFSPGSVYGDLNAQFRDLGGLVGWATSTVSNVVTGEDTFFNDSPRLAEAGMMNSHRKHFWDMSLGGGGPFGEALRRVLPAFSKDYDRVNPLINSMPAWLPANLHWGDPFASLPGGEAMLPGPGYERLHPELRGVDPENYPLIYQYDILSQVSPKSSNLRDTRDRVYRQRQEGAYSREAEEWIDRIDHVVAKQWNILDFDRADPNAIELPGISRLTQAGWFTARERLRAYAAPVENLLPVRPVQKLLGGDRDPIEQYEYERMYGSGGNAFWDKPFRDYLRPSMYSLASLMGYEGKPKWRVDADATNKLFDEIEFTKWMSLAQQAQLDGDVRRKIQYEYQAANTRMGVNPQGNPLSIYWSLPAEDRAYFNSFAFAQGKDRDRVLQMIPSDQVHLYQALWSRVDQDDPSLWSGFSTGPSEDYMYRQYYGMDQSALPPADWIGRNPDIDLRDIKVRYIDELAKDYRDYGEWQSAERNAFSQPILEGSTDVIHREMGLSRGGVTRRLKELFGGPSANLNVFSSNATNGNLQVQYNDDRRVEINQAVGEYLNGRQ